MFQELSFPDGSFPDENIVKKWLALCKDAFKSSESDVTIAIHCVAGLGR